MAGLPKKYAKMGFEKGWRAFKASKKKRKKNPSSKKKVRRKMARRRYTRKRRRRKFTLPLAPVLGLAAGMAPAVPKIMAGDIQGVINELSNNYLGYYPPDGNFDAVRLTRGLVPLIIGGLVHKFVGGAPINVNRMLAAANVPVVRV